MLTLTKQVSVAPPEFDAARHLFQGLCATALATLREYADRWHMGQAYGMTFGELVKGLGLDTEHDRALLYAALNFLHTAGNIITEGDLFEWREQR